MMASLLGEVAEYAALFRNGCRLGNVLHGGGVEAAGAKEVECGFEYVVAGLFALGGRWFIFEHGQILLLAGAVVKVFLNEVKNKFEAVYFLTVSDGKKGLSGCVRGSDCTAGRVVRFRVE